METLRHDAAGRGPGEPRWIRMIAISGLVHVAALSSIFLIPDFSPSSRIPGTVYRVDLVELPTRGPAKPAVASAPSSATVQAAPIAPKEPVPARRIAPAPPKEKPVVVAKRTLDVKPKEKPKPEVAPSRLIDEAVSRIERKVLREEAAKPEPAAAPDPIGDAVARLRERGDAGELDAKGTPGPAGEGEPQISGIGISMYQLAVEERIRSNWSYPVALSSFKADKDLFAIVVLKVRSDGSIIESRIKQTSSDSTFDRSVMRAIERSDPLPSFPEGYRKSQEEMEINFNLRDLERN